MGKCNQRHVGVLGPGTTRGGCNQRHGCKVYLGLGMWLLARGLFRVQDVLTIYYLEALPTEDGIKIHMYDW